jgi:hypothetical protein
MPRLVSKKSLTVKENKSESEVSVPTALPTASELPAPSYFEYKLFHPELYSDFSDMLFIDGKFYKREHSNNVCITKEKILAEFLIKKGYQVLEQKAI